MSWQVTTDQTQQRPRRYQATEKRPLRGCSQADGVPTPASEYQADTTQQAPEYQTFRTRDSASGSRYSGESIEPGTDEVEDVWDAVLQDWKLL